MSSKFAPYPAHAARRRDPLPEDHPIAVHVREMERKHLPGHCRKRGDAARLCRSAVTECLADAIASGNPQAVYRLHAMAEHRMMVVTHPTDQAQMESADDGRALFEMSHSACTWYEKFFSIPTGKHFFNALSRYGELSIEEAKTAEADAGDEYANEGQEDDGPSL